MTSRSSWRLDCAEGLQGELLEGHELLATGGSGPLLKQRGCFSLVFGVTPKDEEMDAVPCFGNMFVNMCASYNWKKINQLFKQFIFFFWFWTTFDSPTFGFMGSKGQASTERGPGPPELMLAGAGWPPRVYGRSSDPGESYACQGAQWLCSTSLLFEKT